MLTAIDCVRIAGCDCVYIIQLMDSSDPESLMVASTTTRSSTSAQYRSHSTRNANLRNKPLLDFKHPASWKSWERSASAELDILNLLDAVTYDPPSYEWVCSNHPELHPAHDAALLTSMLEAATSKHFNDARAAYNHLIEWVLLDSKPGLAKQVDRSLAPTRDGPGLWKLILNHISVHERSQQMKAGGLWADIHARSFDLDGSKGTASPFQEHLTADEIHDVIMGITDTWTCIVGNVETNASECVFTILRLLQRRPDIATFARDTEREYRRMEARAEPIDLNLTVKYITDELDVQLPQLAAPATGNSVFDTIFELGRASSPLDAGASLHRMQPDRSRSGPPRRDDRTRSTSFRPDDTRGGLSRTSPHPGDGRRPRTSLNHCPFCISKLCPARTGAKCEDCIVHNTDIKLPPWASESNLRHLGIAMLYAKENPTVKSFKNIDVIDWALKKLSTPMLKARRRSAGDNMLAQFLDPDDDSAEDPELSELAESDALRALYDEQDTEPAFRATSTLQLSQSVASLPSDTAVDLSNLDQPSLDAHATAFMDGIDSSAEPISDSPFAHAGCMHALLDAVQSVDHLSVLDASPRIAMMVSGGRGASTDKGGQRPIMPGLGRGRGERLIHAKGSIANDENSAALVAPRMSAGAKPFTQTGKQRPINPGHYRSMFKPPTSPSAAALSAMQRASSQLSDSSSNAIPRIRRYQCDDELVRVRSLSLAPAPALAQSDGNDGSCVSAEQPASASAPSAISCAAHDEHDPNHAPLNAAAQPPTSAPAANPVVAAPANSCAANDQHGSVHVTHDAAAQRSTFTPAEALEERIYDDLLKIQQRIDSVVTGQNALASRLNTVDKQLSNDREADVDFKSNTLAQFAAINNRFDALTNGVDDVGALSAMQTTIATLTARLETLERPCDAAACKSSTCNAAPSPSLALITDRQNLLDESIRVLDMSVGKLRNDLVAATDAKLPDLYRIVSPDATVSRLDKLESDISDLHAQLERKPASIVVGSWADASDDAQQFQALRSQSANTTVAVAELATKVLSMKESVSTADSALRERLDLLDTRTSNFESRADSLSELGGSLDERVTQRCSSLEARMQSQETEVRSLMNPSGPHFAMLDDIVKSVDARQSAQKRDLDNVAVRTSTLESSLTNCAQRLHAQGCDLGDVQRHVDSLRARIPLLHSSPSYSASSVNLIDSHVDAPSSPSTSYVPLHVPDVVETDASSIHLSAIRYIQAHALGRGVRKLYRKMRLAACTLQAHARAKPWRLWTSAALSERREFQVVAALHQDFTAKIHADARSLTPTRRSPRVNSGVIYRYSPTTLPHFQQPATRT